VQYNFQVFDTSAPESKIGIDFNEKYGYWERKDGSEGGGLWFELNEETEMLELIDFDGAYELPARVIRVLRAQKVLVPWEYYEV
jgi:hypothetical protein